MRSLLILVLLCISLSLSAVTYYVDSQGSDSNTGTSGSPWKTLAYACSKATVAGDIIHINAGTYTLSTYVNVPKGVSIEGDGVTTILNSTYNPGAYGTNDNSTKFTLHLFDAAGTNGNQSISNLKMTGSTYAAFGAIAIDGRSNVSIHHCTFEYFYPCAVQYNSLANKSTDGFDPPASFATGNSFHDNIVTNSGAAYGGDDGNRTALHILGQDGMTIYNNTIVNNRPDGCNGNCIGGVTGYIKNVKIYNNTLTRIFNPNASGFMGLMKWDFAIEIWNYLGGVEIYNNNIQGDIDIGGWANVKGSSTYSCWVHDNTIGPAARIASGSTRGIICEGADDAIIIERNRIKNVTCGIYFPIFPNRNQTNIRISYNIFENIGSEDGNYPSGGQIQSQGWGINWTNNMGGSTVDNIQVLNNIFIAGNASANHVMWGIGLPEIGTISNVEVRNNIVSNFSYGVFSNNVNGLVSSSNNVHIDNNIFYNTGTLINITGYTPSSYTANSNLTSNPLFVSSSDYHLQSTSPAIGKGMPISCLISDFEGKAVNNPPNIGLYESGSVVPVPVIPVYQSSSITNTTPSVLEMTYNATLTSIIPAVSSYSVLVNSTVRSVSSVSVAGTKVSLTLTSPIVYGDVVTVSYIKPAVNPIQTSSGGQAVSISNQSVTNNVVAISPVYVSSAVANTTPSLVEITYNLALANLVPAASSFSVLVNSAVRTVSTVAISGSKVQLTLASPVVYGDVITFSYTKPASNPVQTTSGGKAATISAQTVTNNVAGVNPVYVSSAIASATPSVLEMTYNLALANLVPAASSFSVLVNSAVRTVSTVVLSGTKVQLTLASPVVYGDVITVSYTKPASNPIQTTTGAQAVALSAQVVTNNVAGVNPVYVSSAVASATPSLLEMTYNLTLANIVPAASSFFVLVNSAVRTVSTVVLSGTKVQLTLASPVVYGDVITVSYTKPASNPIQTTTGAQAVALSAQPATNNVAGVNPIYVSSAVASSTPSLLEMTYNQTLANIVPAASSFSVLVNSAVRTVSTVVLSGTKVQLTLASPVVYGDVITVSYTKPASNPIQTTTGAQAVALSAQPVTNNVAGINPVYVSSAVANATPSILEMTYNLSLAGVIPATSAFTVLVNSSVRSISSVVVSGTRVQLTLSNRIFSGDIVTISYTKPATNPIQTLTGVTAVTIVNQIVTNNCTNLAPSVTITSPVLKGTFTAAANITITATASDADGFISLVEFYNGSTKLGSSTTSPYSFTWSNVKSGNYTLTVVATDNQNSKTSSSAITVMVTASANARNKHPYIKIFNPAKGNSLTQLATITVDAVASDTDGVVSKVEFFNGSARLAEVTTSPYTFTWKDVPAGKYSITAVATDNSNDTTMSSPIEFIVGTVVRYDPKNEMVKLYPNPNNGHFSIEFMNPMKSEKSEIVITDMAGKQVYSGPVLKEEITKQIDLPDSKSGIYVMMIKDKDILVTKKFILN